METQKITREPVEKKGFYARLVGYARFLMVVLIFHFALIVIISCSQEPKKNRKSIEKKVSLIVQRNIDEDRKKIAEIEKQPEEEIEAEVEIEVPEVMTEDAEVVVEDVAVDASAVDVVMPNILKVKPANSALVMPALFGMRSGSGRKAALKCYGASAKTVYSSKVQAYTPPVSNDKYAAEENFIENGNNRVILATDGDFNVGVTGNDGLKKLIENKKKSGVFLTVIGMGEGNLNDSMMETISNYGNGNYYYIDSFNEARKVFSTDFDKNMFTIAKDVKIQIEFNPFFVAEYKLIGYENRVLKKEDFNDDKKDAGEVGNGHTVTYLYEIVPVGKTSSLVDSLKYQKRPSRPDAKYRNNREMFTLKLRYKKPEKSRSVKLEFPMLYKKIFRETPSQNFNMASAAASLAMRLNQPEEQTYDLDQVLQQVLAARGKDKYGYRSEFMDLVKNAKEIY